MTDTKTAERNKEEAAKDYAKEAKSNQPASKAPAPRVAVPFPRIDPRTGQPVQYQEVADTSSTTPESERVMATSAETHARFLKSALLRILAVHGAAEENINFDHEYWHLKEVYDAIPPPVPVP